MKIIQHRPWLVLGILASLIVVTIVLAVPAFSYLQQLTVVNGQNLAGYQRPARICLRHDLWTELQCVGLHGIPGEMEPESYDWIEYHRQHYGA